MKKYIALSLAIPSLGIILIGLFLYFHDKSTPVSTEKVLMPSASSTTSMLLTSPSFKNNEPIPNKFTCDGGDINPQLMIDNIPPEAKSLALIVDDSDAPSGTFTHWTVWNINPETQFIKEESSPHGSIEGETSFNKIGYGGPCPPAGKPHQYRFTLYALDSMLSLADGARRGDLEKEIKKHVIAEAELVGVYQRR